MDWIISLSASATNKDRFFTFVAILWSVFHFHCHDMSIWKQRNKKVFSNTRFVANVALTMATDNATWLKKNPPPGLLGLT